MTDDWEVTQKLEELERQIKTVQGTIHGVQTMMVMVSSNSQNIISLNDRVTNLEQQIQKITDVLGYLHEELELIKSSRYEKKEITDGIEDAEILE
jgi:hypothetical protein